MKVISLGMGQKIFEENSTVQQRQIEYGKLFDELHIVVFTPNDSKFQNIKISNNVFLYATKTKIRILYALDFLKIIKKILKSHDKKDFVLTCQDPFEIGIVGAFVKLCYNLPLHIQIHTDPFGKYFSKYLLNKIRLIFAEFVIKYSDRARAVSERIKESVKDFSKNVDVLPISQGLTLGFSRGEPLKNFVPKGSPLKIITVCRLEREKNLETAIKAFKIASEKFSDIIFTIMGDGSERNSLELLAKSLKLENKVIFAGWQNNLKKYYEEADIYISTSLYEGYGVSLVEAGSFGLSLVLSDTGIAGDVYKNEDSALICDALDTDCFAKNILRLRENKNLAEKLSRRAREEVEKHLEINKNYFEKYANSIKRTAQNFKRKNIFKRIFEFKITFWSASIYARYFVCGITAAAINILALYIFTDTFGIWYLYSSILAFLLALFISFALQKFVVFRDRNTEKIHHQFSKFLAVAIFGVITNTVIMFVCVDFLGIWYILSQVIAGFFVMIQNFLLYKLFIFNNTKTELPQNSY